jgi:tyrosine-protein phosphatase SIW14
MNHPGTLATIPALALVFAAGSAWGAAVAAPGVPNFHQVTDTIYRGAQPADQGWKSLAGLGIKVVIDLRREGEDGHSTAAEAKAVQAAGMRYVHVPMAGLVAPSNAQIDKVVTLFASGEPVFVHCKRGKDRTGTAIACYRIRQQGWLNAKALSEAKSLGLHWIELGMKSYINSYKAPAIQASTAVGAGSQ